MDKKLIIFTDLDGTLLDSDYSFRRALPALKLIKEKGIPLVICSSKTRIEIEHCRKRLKNEHPFVSENGGGIYFSKELRIMNYELRVTKGKDYNVIKLGASYADLRNALQELRSEGFDVNGFGDMSVDEVVELTGLKPADAKRAKQRDYDEPFVFYGDKKNEARLKRRIKAKGFNYTQGEYLHIIGDSDKGRAVAILKGLYSGKYGKIFTAALGDSPNDIEMLRNVDYRVLVKKKDGKYDSRIRVGNLVKADGIGPEGWNSAVIQLIGKLKVS